ncbi:transmembrane protein 61 [Gracilinanus agilis]|uniref:transmembrane protein 61 n=1 Tax=Gracilinanus agilis TaxID=191870 RepID=UPI001CFEB909|nr:transmembrane protein 61 [Gracilinanus agilis]
MGESDSSAPRPPPGPPQPCQAALHMASFSLFLSVQPCDRRVASSFRYGVTITGAVVLVTGTLCFAWWSDGDVEPSLSPETKASLPGKAAPAAGTRAPPAAPPSALLRSVSFFCCGVGGMLLLWGLLWSAKANVRAAPRCYPSRLPRSLGYLTAEPVEKWNHSSWASSSVPTYEMAMSCSPPVPEEEEESGPPPYSRTNGMAAGGLTRSISDGALLVPSQPEMWGNQGIAWVSPPPSYESINAYGL